MIIFLKTFFFSLGLAAFSFSIWAQEVHFIKVKDAVLKQKKPVQVPIRIIKNYLSESNIDFNELNWDNLDINLFYLKSCRLPKSEFFKTYQKLISQEKLKSFNEKTKC